MNVQSRGLAIGAQAKAGRGLLQDMSIKFTILLHGK
jgi:hypothetical protein